MQDNLLLFVVITGIVLAAAAGGWYFWTRAHVPNQAQTAPQEAESPLDRLPFRAEPLSVTFYYPVDGMLVAGTASASRQPDLQSQAREALAAVFLDERAAQAPVLRDLKLRALYLDRQGTAYVDLTSVLQQSVKASAWDEQLAMYAMVNTLMQNFEEIREVAFLVDGRQAPTLAGHMDLSRRYGKRMDLVKQDSGI
jgi:hypothetical protein